MPDRQSISDRFRTPACPEAPFKDPSCVVLSYVSAYLEAAFPINIKSGGQVNRGLDAVYAVKVDNLYGARELVILANDSGDVLTVPPGCGGMFPLYSKTCVFTISDAPLLSGSNPLSNRRSITFYDTPQTYYSNTGEVVGSQLITGAISLQGFPANVQYVNNIVPALPGSVVYRRLSYLKVSFDVCSQQVFGDTNLSCAVVFRRGITVVSTIFSRVAYSYSGNVFQNFQFFDSDLTPDITYPSDLDLCLLAISGPSQIFFCTPTWNVILATANESSF